MHAVDFECAVKPGYNDIDLCDTLSVASDIVLPINSIPLYFSVIIALVYNDRKYSFPFMKCQPR